MDKLPHDFPEVDESQLVKITKSLKRKGADRALRLFACWCARGLDPGSSGWVNWIDAAEKFACEDNNGIISDSLEYGMSKNTGMAAWLCGWRNADPSAAVCLAAAATLNLEASSAAVAAANWQRRYHILVGIKRGDDREQVKAADSLLAGRQIEMLREFARDHSDKHAPERLPIPEGGGSELEEKHVSAAGKKSGSRGGFSMRPGEDMSLEEFAEAGWESICEMMRNEYEEHPEIFPDGLPKQYKKKLSGEDRETPA